jgi:hypothetical protein
LVLEQLVKIVRIKLVLTAVIQPLQQLLLLVVVEVAATVQRQAMADQAADHILVLVVPVLQDKEMLAAVDQQEHLMDQVVAVVQVLLDNLQILAEPK